MTDQPEIERQLGIASLPLFLISPAWGLNLPYIDNIAVLLQILINETFYGVSICCRVSNIFPTICYHYLWLVFDIPIIARIYPSLTSTSFLPSPVLYQQWMGGPGVVGAVHKLWQKYYSKISNIPISSLASSKGRRALGASPDLREFVWGQMFLSPNKHQQEYQTRPPPASLTARKLVKSEGNNMFSFWLEKFF